MDIALEKHHVTQSYNSTSRSMMHSYPFERTETLSCVCELKHRSELRLRSVNQKSSVACWQRATAACHAEKRKRRLCVPLRQFTTGTGATTSSQSQSHKRPKSFRVSAPDGGGARSVLPGVHHPTDVGLLWWVGAVAGFLLPQHLEKEKSKIKILNCKLVGP